MAFWWVNHNKTFTSEIEGGYIWSPMTNQSGARDRNLYQSNLNKAWRYCIFLCLTENPGNWSGFVTLSKAT